jgi:hypothetical protein
MLPQMPQSRPENHGAGGPVRSWYSVNLDFDIASKHLIYRNARVEGKFNCENCGEGIIQIIGGGLSASPSMPQSMLRMDWLAGEVGDESGHDIDD